jgi:hypothetical protein
MAKKSSRGKRTKRARKGGPKRKKLIIEVDFSASPTVPPYYQGTFHVKGFPKKRRK